MSSSTVGGLGVPFGVVGGVGLAETGASVSTLIVSAVLMILLGALFTVRGRKYQPAQK